MSNAILDRVDRLRIERHPGQDILGCDYFAQVVHDVGQIWLGQLQRDAAL